ISARKESIQHHANFLTNRRFSPSSTAGNAWRPRQRMRTLRIGRRERKQFFVKKYRAVIKAS
ncbi:hypothetical protein ACGK9R_16790, partial [Halomonas sp. HNIBRBA4712]|uniref:hypothetical protein n=1 Tax=Halomonas sp. HNIBRBA4712 TaxID=3373087 RepID=UPI003746CFE5